MGSGRPGRDAGAVAGVSAVMVGTTSMSDTGSSRVAPPIGVRVTGLPRCMPHAAGSKERATSASRIV